MARWVAVAAALLSSATPALPQDAKAEVELAVQRLLERQEEDGSWGRESVFGRDTNIRASITLICVEALEAAPGADDRRRAAIDKGRAYALRHAADRPERPSYQMYDFSFYSGLYALAYFSRAAKAEPKLAGDVRRFLETVAVNQRKSGGYSYVWRSREADSYESFASALVALSLRQAKEAGVEFPDELYERCVASIERSRLDGGFFGYHIVDGVPRGSFSGNGSLALEGCLVRSVVCEYALLEAGRSDAEKLKKAVDDFFRHREELEKVRKRDQRTHQGDFDNAPYYFFFGHYYAALALSKLDRETRERHAKELRGILRSIRDEDGTWHDSRITGASYGTAMGLLTLLRLLPSEY
jgi:hypothetical protein